MNICGFDSFLIRCNSITLPSDNFFAFFLNGVTAPLYYPNRYSDVRQLLGCQVVDTSARLFHVRQIVCLGHHYHHWFRSVSSRFASRNCYYIIVVNSIIKTHDINRLQTQTQRSVSILKVSIRFQKPSALVVKQFYESSQ